MIKNILISNPKELKRIVKIFFKDGPDKLHILTDFDRTLTTAFIDGKSVPSLISILRDGNYLTPDYSQKANELYTKYHPIEIAPKILLAEKKKAMFEWWSTHFDLLIKSGLNRKDIKNVVESGKIKFRDGFGKFVDFLHQQQIPLVIMSSCGLGQEAISMFLEKQGKLYDNVYIVSNSFQWDENGRAISVRQPIIHTLNKDETSVQNFPIFDIIKDRKNVLLLGDSLDDLGMLKGFDYDNLIKIGFLNENIEENLEYYKQNYEVVILNDSSMDYVNVLLREIVK